MISGNYVDIAIINSVPDLELKYVNSSRGETDPGHPETYWNPPPPPVIESVGDALDWWHPQVFRTYHFKQQASGPGATHRPYSGWVEYAGGGGTFTMRWNQPGLDLNNPENFCRWTVPPEYEVHNSYVSSEDALNFNPNQVTWASCLRRHHEYEGAELYETLTKVRLVP